MIHSANYKIHPANYMNLRTAILAESEILPPIAALGYEYVLGLGGLYVRAEDSRLAACVPVAPARLHGLADVLPLVEFKLPRIPATFLAAVLESAQRHLPNEALYQFVYDAMISDTPKCSWRCVMPPQSATPGAIEFEDIPNTVVDLHSHGALPAFFSESADDVDERGFRVYAVIGKVDTNRPQIAVRVGVYGHFWNIAPDLVFEPSLLFDTVDPEVEYALYNQTDTVDEQTNPLAPVEYETESGLAVVKFGGHHAER